MAVFAVETVARLLRDGRLPAVTSWTVEPRHGHVAVLVYRDGARRVIRDGDLGHNPSAGAAVARDKDFTKFVLGQAGLPSLPGFSFALPNWLRHTRQGQVGLAQVQAQVRERVIAEGLAFPLYVKPNDGSQGLDVFRCRSEADLTAAVAQFERHQVQLGLVEAALDWPAHRLVVLDSSVVCAYQTLPLTVSGDGRSDLGQLIERARADLERRGRAVRIDLDDPRIPATLAEQGLDVSAVPAAGQAVRVRDSSNLSAGGSARAVPIEAAPAEDGIGRVGPGEDGARRVDPSWLALAQSAAAALGLNWCGVDLLCPDITRPGQGFLLEVNASPGLEHYASLGPAQLGRVEESYVRMLERSPGR
ncbi:MAG: hypothetical protein LBK54_00220 [Propionibacteriaceae bacterium]|jgi:D-alanine-D-alanine ligase-like ATP-grasp enzyme|nr:hypothetical protein [Propionibacteriaceae bacterium]